MFSIDFQNYKSNDSKYQKSYNYFQIDNKKINIDDDYHKMILDGEFNLDPNYFLRCLLANLDKYKEDALDTVTKEFNFVVLSHGRNISKILGFFSKDYPKITEVINNEVYKIPKSIFIDLDRDYTTKINYLLHRDLRDLIINSLITKLTYFKYSHVNINLDNLQTKDLFDMCCYHSTDYSKSNCAKKSNSETKIIDPVNDAKLINDYNETIQKIILGEFSSMVNDDLSDTSEEYDLGI